jgi:RNA polymerase sigma factor (sigma-70 family)
MMETTTLTLEHLYTAYQEQVFRSIHFHYHVPYEDAEDLTQEVFLKAARALPSLDGGYVRNWLYRVARTTAIDYYRSRSMCQRCAPSCSLQALQPEHEGLASNEDVQASSLRRLSFQDAFARLTREQQRLLVYAAQGWTMQEIATACSLTLANTKTRVMRARIALKQHYQEAGV